MRALNDTIKNKADILAVILLAIAAPYFIAKGQYQIIGLGILFLILVLIRPIYPLYLFSLVFWIPRQVKKYFLEDILIHANATELFFYGILLLYIITKALKKERVVFKAPLLKFLFIFIFGSLIAYLAGDAPDRILDYMLFRKNCIYGVLIYIAMVNFVRGETDAERILTCLIIGSLILGLFIFHGFYFGLGSLEETDEGRVGGSFILYGKQAFGLTCMALAGQAATIIPLSLAFFLMAKKRYVRLASFVAFSGFILILIGTMTRSAWISAVLGIIAVSIFWFRFSSLERKTAVANIFYLILFIIAVGVGIYIMLYLNPEIISRAESLRYFTTDLSLLTRVDIWFSGLKTFLANPFGMGFREVYPLEVSLVYPHSLYVGILLSSGFIAAFGFFGFLYKWLKKIFTAMMLAESRPAKAIFVGAIGTLTSFLFYGLFEYLAFSPDATMVPVWIILGVTIALCGNTPTNKQTR